LKVMARGDSSGIGRGPASVEKQSEVPPELKSYVDAVTKAVQRKWYELISFLPKSKLGNMGNIDIEFTVHQDGTVADMKLVSASGDRDLDKVAWEAIRQMSPFSPFPHAAKVDRVLLRIHFAYR
ncbi:MAG: TonB family protein, partial [Terriglobales bacterium]